MERLEIIAVDGIGEVSEGADLARLIAEATEAQGTPLVDGDIVVVTQKIVSKAEGRIVDCPDDAARLQLAIDEAVRVLRRRGDLVITETSHGFVCANSGVDASNLPEGKAALLPIDPDRSAARIRSGLAETADVGVLVTDTFGRAWRLGLTDVAIGVAGVAPIVDLRGTKDWSGHELAVTEIAVADEIAGAAELVMGKASGCPVAIVRGYSGPRSIDASGTQLVRPPSEDLFR
ncbi:MAG: coenzyme F420-0:L-glutamate ligase [Acidobacteria bacterium]|nr:MAG: coenzyme F420-0:L-glutamate ligase [Acidobacteriota bacterium]